MAYIEWNESLSVRIESIDKQHKKLINMINIFYINIRDKSNNDLISDLITKMKEYTIIHFKTEEDYFRKYNYPALDKHNQEHDKFIKKVADLEKRFNENKVILSYEITSYLKEWIKDHIQLSDKKYSDFLIKNGVK